MNNGINQGSCDPTLMVTLGTNCLNFKMSPPMFVNVPAWKGCGFPWALEAVTKW